MCSYMYILRTYFIPNPYMFCYRCDRYIDSGWSKMPCTLEKNSTVLQ